MQGYNIFAPINGVPVDFTDTNNNIMLAILCMYMYIIQLLLVPLKLLSNKILYISVDFMHSL